MLALRDTAVAAAEHAGRRLTCRPAGTVATEGRRTVDCHVLRRRISDGTIRPREAAVGAHLYACEDCRTYVKAIAMRETGLAALSPPLSPWAAVAVLESVMEKRRSL